MTKNELIESISPKAGWLNAYYPSIKELAAPVKHRGCIGSGRKCGSIENYAVSRAIALGKFDISSIEQLIDAAGYCWDEAEYSAECGSLNYGDWVEHARRWQKQAQRLREAMQAGNGLRYQIWEVVK